MTNATATFQFRRGTIPLLLSLPHEGFEIPAEVAKTMTDAGRTSWDTDWFLDRLYGLDELRHASRLAGRFSRYVIDLNRPIEDESLYPGQNTTGLFPQITFDQEPIYPPGSRPDVAECCRRIREYWQPYHRQLEDELQRMRTEHGVAVLFEGHSIASRVPYLFDGDLPDLNLGTNRGQSCAPSLTQALMAAVKSQEQYSHVLNGRFVGGFITRHYGDPENQVHAVQLELSQATHLDEKTKSWHEQKVASIRPVLQNIMQAIVGWIEEKRWMQG